MESIWAANLNGTSHAPRPRVRAALRDFRRRPSAQDDVADEPGCGAARFVELLTTRGSGVIHLADRDATSRERATLVESPIGTPARGAA